MLGEASEVLVSDTAEVGRLGGEECPFTEKPSITVVIFFVYV